MNLLQVIQDTMQRISGGKPADYYLAGIFFSCIAILLSWYLHSRKRDPASPNTPEKFSWLFLIWDNVKKSVVTLLLMFVLFRVFDLSNILLMIGVGFFLSLGLDKAIEWLMDNTNFLKLLERNRDNFPQKPTT